MQLGVYSITSMIVDLEPAVILFVVDMKIRMKERRQLWHGA
jgi:hypothetical protein